MSTPNMPNASVPGGRYSAILLDLDGTMVDTIGDFVQAMNRTFEELGQPTVAADLVATWVGRGGPHLINEARLHAGLAADQGDVMREGFFRHYGLINGQYSATFPGVEAGLTRWQAAGVGLACVTNKPEAHARELLALKGLDRFFGDRVWGGDTLAERKPHALPLLTACAALGVPASKALMVGDSHTDAHAAQAAGMDAALLSWGYNHGKPIEALPAVLHADAFETLVDFWASSP